MIIFTNNIVSVKSFPKYKDHCSEYRVVRNYKRRIGYKFLIIPVYEIIEEAVLYTPWTVSEYYCELKDFKSDTSYFEDDILYDKPHCNIKTNDGKLNTKYFNTVEELNDFVNDLASKAPHIKL